MPRETKPNESPATLVAIAFAARGVGDRELARDAIAKLKDRFGVRLIFTRPAKQRGIAACS